MYKSKFVFAQLHSFLDYQKFRHIVDKYQGNRYVKTFTCWNQLLALMFGQLCNRISLRDLIVAIEAHRSKSYHLGFGSSVTRSNLAKANQNRDYRIFEEYDIETQIPTFFHITTASVNDVNAMDEIPYQPDAYYVFDRGYNDFKRLYKINTIGSYFVVRAKKNIQYKAVKWKRKLPKNVLSDTLIELTGFYPKQYYTERFRLIRYWDDEQKREFIFLTNALSLTSLQVANRCRKYMLLIISSI